MKRQLSNTIYVQKFAIEKNNFKRLQSSSEKKRNDIVANSIEKRKNLSIYNEIETNRSDTLKSE